MKIKLEREKLIKVGFILLAAFLIFEIFIRPQWDHLKAVRSSYHAGLKLLETRHQEQEKLKAFLDIHQEWEDKHRRFESRLIRENEVNTFLQNLTYLAKETKNRLIFVNPMVKKSHPKAGLQKIGVELALAGKFPSIMDFFQTLGTDGKALNISDLKIVRKDEEKKDLKASFHISFFVLSTVH